MFRAATLIASTSKSAGDGVDESGPALAELVREIGAELVETKLVPDDQSLIERQLLELSDDLRCDLILTSGGTGMSPTDLTPEATRAVIDREAPGIAEAIRLASREHTTFWPLSRGVAGIRGGSLIVNLPGNPRSIREVGGMLVETLPHALRLIAETDPGH